MILYEKGCPTVAFADSELVITGCAVWPLADIGTCASVTSTAGATKPTGAPQTDRQATVRARSPNFDEDLDGCFMFR